MSIGVETTSRTTTYCERHLGKPPIVIAKRKTFRCPSGERTIWVWSCRTQAFTRRLDKMLPHLRKSPHWTLTKRAAQRHKQRRSSHKERLATAQRRSIWQLSGRDRPFSEQMPTTASQQASTKQPSPPSRYSSNSAARRSPRTAVARIRCGLSTKSTPTISSNRVKAATTNLDQVSNGRMT